MALSNESKNKRGSISHGLIDRSVHAAAEVLATRVSVPSIRKLGENFVPNATQCKLSFAVISRTFKITGLVPPKRNHEF